MGAGKEAPPAAGGGDEAAPEPVVLRMVLHCDGCAKKVKKSIHRMPGVVSVAANAAANTVVVAGTADAAALKARIESRTHKPVEIVSAPPSKHGPPPPPAADPKKSPAKDGGEQKKSPDKGDKAGPSSSPSKPKEEEGKGKKQPPEEKKPAEETPTTATTALLRIRLHCDGCADRIRRRIYKIKGVKDVVLEGNGKDEVQVVGTMDVPAMVAYLNGKLNRTVELAAPGKKDGHKDKAGDGDGDGHAKQKDKAAGDGGHKDKGKGVEVAGPPLASAAASMAPAPVQASTHHVSPYGNVAYPQAQPQGPQPGYYGGYYGGGGNAGGAGYANPYYQQPRSDAGSYYQHQPSADAGYYQQQPRGDAGGYYQHQPSADAGSYYQHPGGYGQHPNPQTYPPPYGFDMSPPSQMFSDENPNGCSVM